MSRGNICVKCGSKYQFAYHPSSSINMCKSCYKIFAKGRNRSDNVSIISFIIFPLGLLIYFLNKNKNPGLAMSALKPALIAMGIVIGIPVGIGLLGYVIGIAINTFI